MNIRSHAELCRLAVYTPDGLYGPVEDVIIEDDSWRLTHFACLSDADTPGRDILIPVELVSDVDFSAGRLMVDRTNEELRRSLSLAVTQTGTRLNGLRMDRALSARPMYVAGVSRGGQPQPLTPGQPVDTEVAPEDSGPEDALARLNDSSHYRRGIDLIDYHLKSKNGVIGPIRELLFDMAVQRLRHVIVEVFVDQRHNKKVLLPLPELAAWRDRRLYVAASASIVEDGPTVIDGDRVSRDDTTRSETHFLHRS